MIGGIAATLYGVPRATFDMDILIEASPKNVELLLSALLDAGFGTAGIVSVESILENEITIFDDRIRIDVQTRTPGLNFAEAWDRRETMTYRGQEFQIVTKEDLIASKKAAGRDIDIEDVKQLELDEHE
ncbi:MAG: DUF6036 family nucleotidyltransferase [bacterium]